VHNEGHVPNVNEVRAIGVEKKNSIEEMRLM
jgi:hypothetical protein